jgi:hypothetical protein
MNEYLNLTNRKLIINPIITDNDNNLNTNTIINQNINTLDFKKNPNYYKTNYYSNYIIQYIQNSPSSNSSQEYINIFNQWVKDYPSIEVTNWKVFESFILPNMTVDPNKWAIIYHFMLYISLFDYTQKKQILLFMSNFQFPAFLSIINYLSSDFENIFNVKNVLYNFQNNSSIIFTNTQNRDQFTSDLLSDSRTDTLWYNNGNTFMNLLDLFKPRIFFPRYDQSMNVFINKLSLELDMYSTNNTYIDLAESSQILLIPIYNAIQFLFHFYRNGVSINSFIFDYFSKSKLLRFGNNLIFDTNMDNVYDIVVGTSYFNSEDTIINRNIHRNIINIFINLRVLNYENSDTIINESDIIVVNDEMILKKEKFTLIDNWARLYNLVKGSTTISDMNAAFRNDKQYQGYNLNIKVNGIVITDSNNRQNILNDQIIINSFNYYFVNGFTLTQTNKPISSN